MATASVLVCTAMVRLAHASALEPVNEDDVVDDVVVGGVTTTAC